MANPFAQFAVPVSANETVQDNPFAKFKPGAPEKKPLAWSDVPGEAISNLPSSAGKFAGSIAHAVMHPIDTATTIADVGAGALRAGAKKVLPEAVFNAIDSVDNAETRQRIGSRATEAGQVLSDRYGSADAIKNTLATDPVGAMADASAVLTGGGAIAARAPSVAGAAGRAAYGAGRMIDPLAVAGRTVAAGGNAAASVLGVTTGAGARPFREAFQAGRDVNPAFTEHMRGQRPVADVVDMAENAVGALGRERSAAYTAGMQGVRSNQGAVHFTPVFDALRQARDDAHFQGVPIDAAAADVVQRMTDITHQFARIPGPPTAERFDALKRALGEIHQRTQQGTLEYRVAGQVYNTVRDEIIRQVPEYAATMRDYSNASDNIAEMRRTMSINDRAMTDTTLRKLQSTMRNNVNTNYGARERLLDNLAQHQPNLPPALAGQSLNTIAPRGLARISPMSIVASGTASMNPATLAALPLTSPRLMGELTYGAGRATGAVERAMQAAGLPPEVIANALLGAYVGDTPERERNALYGGQ